MTLQQPGESCTEAGSRLRFRHQTESQIPGATLEIADGLATKHHPSEGLRLVPSGLHVICRPRLRQLIPPSPMHGTRMTAASEPLPSDYLKKDASNIPWWTSVSSRAMMHPNSLTRRTKSSQPGAKSFQGSTKCLAHSHMTLFGHMIQGGRRGYPEIRLAARGPGHTSALNRKVPTLKVSLVMN